MLLMHRNIPTAVLEMKNGIPIGFQTILNKSELPLGTYHENPSTHKILFHKWYSSRSIPDARHGISILEKELGKTRAELFLDTTGVSITDGYWIAEESSNVAWEDINYHDNGFDETLLQAKVNQRITGTHSPDMTTDGVMDKFWYHAHGMPHLAKLDYDRDGILMANEVVYSNIACLCNVNTTPYTIGKLDTLLFCTCPSFITNAEDDFITAMQVKHSNLRLSGERLLQHFMQNLGFETEIRQMMTMDCILHNTDRHEKNFGYIRHKDGSISFAPLYDNGYCLGTNHDSSVIVTDADMKLLPDTRSQILERYGTIIPLDKSALLSELEHTYALYSIPEDRYEIAKSELLMGMAIYEDYAMSKQVSVGISTDVFKIER